MKQVANTPKIYLWTLLIILSLGLFFRVYKIDSLPEGLHRDEASIGYNAYLIFHTLRDEHGKFLPLVFEAFGDWKRPINIYLSALLIPITGMSAVTVRLPVAIFGLISIYVVYLIVFKLSKNQFLSLLSAFVLALSPWHIYMSRTGLGWNVIGLTIFLLACYLLILARSSRLFGFLSGCMFGFSLFSYASNQFITPLFILFLTLWHIVRSKRLQVRWEFMIPIMIFFSVFVGTYLNVFKENSSGSSFFTDSYKYTSIETPYSEHDSRLSARVFHNKLAGWVEKYIQNYLQVFSPQFFLYNTADNPSYSLKNGGNIYLFELAFLLLGTYIFLRQKPTYFWFIVFLIIVTPIPAALTLNPISSTRTLLFVPIYSLFIATGIYHGFNVLKNKKILYGNVFIILVGIFYTMSIIKLADEYLVHFPKNRVEHWGNAQKQLVDYLIQNGDKYDEILISRPNETFYIYLMYYSYFDKYKPSQISYYPKTEDGFVYAKSLDKYSFRDIQYVDDLRIPNRLIVDKTIDMESLATPSSYLANEYSSEPLYTEVKVEKTIKLPNGLPAYSILSTSRLKTFEEITIR